MIRIQTIPLLALLLHCWLSGPVRAQGRPAIDDPAAFYEKIVPSLVVVQYTYDGELGRQELSGQGIVVSADGLIMTPLVLVPRWVPDEQMTDFRVLVPGDDEEELEADFYGRDDRSDVAFVKVRQPRTWRPIAFEEAPVRIGDTVVSVGLLPKEAGHRAFYMRSIVSAVLRGPTPFVFVSAEGLATVGSPVFNAQGKAIGIVPAQQGQNFLLNNGRAMQGLATPPRFFVPTRDFELSLKDPPTGEPLRLPWLGVFSSGISKAVAEYYNLKGMAVAQIGEVVPDSPAARAGLRQGDKIIKLNGQLLERGDEPDETSMMLIRKVRRMKVGEELTLTVVRDRDKPPIDVVVTLGEQPMQVNQARRFYADDIGLSVREMVFDDIYHKRLGAESTGVVVAYLRPSSSAATAALRIGDVITELNSEPVKNLEQFQKSYETFRQQKPKDVVVLVVVREGNTQVIKMEPPQ